MNTVEKATKVRLTFDNWLGLIGLAITLAGGLYYLVDRRFSALEQVQLDHEIRLTRREANAFTSQDAAVLSANVARLAIQITENNELLKKSD